MPILVLLVIAVVIGAIGQLRTRCEVCVEYRGARTCETARAAELPDAAVVKVQKLRDGGGGQV